MDYETSLHERSTSDRERQDFGIEPFVCVGLVGQFGRGSRRGRRTEELEEQFVVSGLVRDAGQVFDLYDQAGLLSYLSDHGIPGGFAGFDSTPWRVPQVEVATMAQQDTAVRAENCRKGPRHEFGLRRRDPWRLTGRVGDTGRPHMVGVARLRPLRRIALEESRRSRCLQVVGMISSDRTIWMKLT